MLVLSRREEDKIVFPNLGVQVQILRIGAGRVRVGIDAPPEIKVLRHELQDAAPAEQGHGRAAVHKARPPVSLGNDRLRRHLESAAEVLGELHRSRDCLGERESEDLIFAAFSHLKSIDEQAAAAANREPALHNRFVKSALVVEDNANEQMLLASYLRLRRFDVATAHDGADALDHLSTHETPDVVLIDMHMPGMDGATAVHCMRKKPEYKDLRIYAVSGGDPVDYGLEISPEGVNGWFPKPLDPEAVLFRLAFDDSDPSLNSRDPSQPARPASQAALPA